MLFLVCFSKFRRCFQNLISIILHHLLIFFIVIDIHIRLIFFAVFFTFFLYTFQLFIILNDKVECGSWVEVDQRVILLTLLLYWLLDCCRELGKALQKSCFSSLILYVLNLSLLILVTIFFLTHLLCLLKWKCVDLGWLENFIIRLGFNRFSLSLIFSSLNFRFYFLLFLFIISVRIMCILFVIVESHSSAGWGRSLRTLFSYLNDVCYMIIYTRPPNLVHSILLLTIVPLNSSLNATLWYLTHVTAIFIKL